MNTIPSVSLSSNLESDNDISNKFVSKVISLKQTNPRKINYTIYVKIIINPYNRDTKEVFFSYQPDRESLESVIDEMIDALQLNKNFHHKIIVNSIENAMKTKQMKIVPTPKTNTDTTFTNNNKTDITENNAFPFIPLSPLVLSPKTLHRKNSNAKFPDLRSNSMSAESDLFTLNSNMNNLYSNENFDYLSYSNDNNQSQ